MSDLDQLRLHEIAFSGPVYQDKHGVEHCFVPRDVLQRVTSAFDIEEVRRTLFGRQH